VEHDLTITQEDMNTMGKNNPTWKIPKLYRKITVTKNPPHHGFPQAVPILRQ
jgi:hypothetical protein